MQISKYSIVYLQPILKINSMDKNTETPLPTFAEIIQSSIEQGKRIAEISERMERMALEHDRRMKETDRQMKETDRQMKETDRKLKQMINQFTTQWGRMIEELAKPAALKLFKEIGIKIDHVFQEPRHRKEEGRELEADVILVNTTDVVVVEVKSTLHIEDVDHFLEQMAFFKDLFREFKDRTVYVAVAAMKFAESSDIYARKKGVFVLHANGEYVFSLDNIPEEKRKRF